MPWDSDPVNALNSESSRCGFVAIVGRPNVGKSTLLNHLIGQKLSITSRKPQTTRHALLGINMAGNAQIIYVDTPGLHGNSGKAINRYMNRTVDSVIQDVDVILFIVDRLKWNEADEQVVQALRKARCPILLVINKVDLIRDKAGLLPHIDELSKKHDFAEYIPVSALKGHNVDELERCIVRYLPEGDYLFPEDQVTDRSQRFIAAEFVREKLTRQLGAEVPYEATVEVEECKQVDDVMHISAVIIVEKPGQKKMIIGSHGARLKHIGSQARAEMEKLFDCRVMLNLWVKVKSGWSDDERALKSLGYKVP